MIYLDSSAITKLFAAEAETTALQHYLSAEGGVGVASSIVAEPEVRRAATRRHLSQEAATAALDRLALAVLDRDLCLDAGLLPGRGMRALDAIHVATARRLGADRFITYDARQAEAAQACGLHVISPA